MRVLFVTSEVAGLFKKGGLADVLYGLPVALTKLGVESVIIMPFYTAIPSAHTNCVGQMAVDFDGKRELVFVFHKKLERTHVPVYLIRHPILNEYNGADMPARFAFFSACVARLYLYAPEVMGGKFEVIHCHDWHTALVPLFLGENQKMEEKGERRKVKGLKVGKKSLMVNRELKIQFRKETMESHQMHTILTIHNLMYTGETGISTIRKTGLPEKLFHMYTTPLGRAIKLLREGLDYVDVITTVSPTYAKEISRTHGLIGAVLSSRKDRVLGILNGIDPTIWDSKSDPALPHHYDILTVQKGKQLIKSTLQSALKLPRRNVPLFGFVGRIEPRQKGTDLIRNAAAALPPDTFQLVILGTGELKEEKLLTRLSSKYQNVRFINTFDERLARRIYAGSDVMLVPSKFEPCGLTQMIAMRYGTIPLVRSTGGLADSVRNGDTGFVFHPYTTGALKEAMRDAIDFWTNKKTLWDEMVLRVMREDFSWRASAKKYLALYEKLTH